MAEVKAVSRIEAILNGDNVTPVSRVEAILNGDDVKPVSRGEYFLKKSIGQGGGVEPEKITIIPLQTVTTVGRVDTFAQINIAEDLGFTDIPDTLTITFQGQEYVCSNHSSDSNYKEYGATYDVDAGKSDWSQYPFAITVFQRTGTGTVGNLYTESAGTFTIEGYGEQYPIFPKGEIEITANGTYDVTEYAMASVNAGITPTGTKTITENGTYDVTNYASASVNVAGSSIEVVPLAITTSDGSAVIMIAYDENGNQVSQAVDGKVYVRKVTVGGNARIEDGFLIWSGSWNSATNITASVTGGTAIVFKDYDLPNHYMSRLVWVQTTSINAPTLTLTVTTS